MFQSSSYSKNLELERLYKKIGFIRVTSSRIRELEDSGISSGKKKTIIRDVLDQLNLQISCSTNVPNTHSINRVLQRQLRDCSPPNRIGWGELYEKIINLTQQIFNLAQDFIKNSDEKNFSKLISISDTCYIEADTFLNALLSHSLNGSIDHCVLPTKNRMPTRISLNKGTILGFDIVDSKTLDKSIYYEILDEIKRVAFTLEGWEWSDLGDGLLILFVDSGPSSHIPHQNRALMTAIEAIARVTHKFPNDLPEFRRDKSLDDDQIKPKYQNLRVALSSYNEDGVIGAAEHVYHILNDKDFKFSNTIFVVGDDLLERVRETTALISFNFSRTVHEHFRIKKPIYWSSPIGWETLNLYRQASLRIRNIKRNQRKTRFQVPNNTVVSILSDDNNKYEGILYDVSTGGLRLRMRDKSPDIRASVDGEVFIFNFNCGQTPLDGIKGQLIDNVETNGPHNSLYSRFKFLESITEKKMRSFLDHCEYQCNAMSGKNGECLS